MKDTTVFVRTSSGGIRPAIVINESIAPIVKRFLIDDLSEVKANGEKCVIAEFDAAQPKPIVRKAVKIGAPTIPRALLSLLTGTYRRRWVYWANSEGLRAIAHHGSPERAFAAQ